jgi:gamma-glutamyltranspeptidase/glutathione hydrolase
MCSKPSLRRRARQFSLAALILTLASCGSDSGSTGAPIPRQFLGAAAADDPQAALVGRDVLSAGGTAADAAVAMYFSMAVLLPSQASLGGGGVCLIFDPPQRRVEQLDFPARAPADAAGSPALAVPGNPRGFFALHARYGRLRWQWLLAPAERQARFGATVSRGLARQISASRAALAGDGEFSRIFAGPGGGPAGEGDIVVQADLAAVLARLRAEGAGDFYSGRFTPRLIDGFTAAGGRITPADLEALPAEWREAVAVRRGRRIAHFTAPPPPGGSLAAGMWTALSEDDRFRRADAFGRDALLVAAGREAFAASGAQPAANAPSADAASLLAVDATGRSVACSVTLNAPFGAGRIAPGTGIVMAAAATPGGPAPAMLVPMIETDRRLRTFHFAAAADGGPVAPGALIAVAAGTLLAEMPLGDAVSDGRAAGTAGAVLVEAAAGPARVQALQQQGQPVTQDAGLGSVLAVACPGGLPDNPESCTVARDPRGYGFSLTAD